MAVYPTADDMAESVLDRLFPRLRSERPDVQRRGKALGVICATFTPISLGVGTSLLFVTALPNATESSVTCWIAGILCAVAASMCAHGRVEGAALLVSYGTSSMVLLGAIMVGEPNYYTSFGALTPLVIGLTGRWQHVVSNTALNIVVLLGLTIGLPIASEDMAQIWMLAAVLLFLNFGTGALSLAYTLVNGRAFEEQERVQHMLRDARARAEAANSTKSLFLANMSHELRTPLNAIIGYSELIVEEVSEVGIDQKSQIIGDLEKVTSSSKHLLRLINDVLDLTKIEAGHLDLYIEPLRLREFLTSMCAQLQPLVDRNHNTLHVTLDHDMPETVYTDETRLTQIMNNLLSNAAKFTERGQITLHATTTHDHDRQTLVLRVTDTGIGMDAQALARVFDSFVQADESTTKHFGGTGLGLTLSRHLTRMLGGEVYVESEPGCGSTFEVHLPMLARAERPLRITPDEI